jgi:outer membrane lipoprotein-sorting protein
MLLLALATMGLPLYAQPELPSQPEPAAASSAQELTVAQILAKHYEAIGGEHHQSVQTMKITGRSIVMGMEAPYTRFAKRPNKTLLRIYVQDMTGVQAFDGETAWGYMPFMGQTEPAIMPPAQTQAILESAEFDGPLVHADKKGHTIELLGIEPVSGHDTYKLRITMKTGGVQTHYIDAETFYVTRVESAAGDAVFFDYRLVDGHPVPQVIEMMGEMGEQIIYIDEVTFGVEIADSAFSMR